MTTRIIARRNRVQKGVYGFLCLAVLLIGGFYTYSAWNEYQDVRKGIADNQVLIKTLEQESGDASAAYFDQKTDYDKLRADTAKQVLTIFPKTDSYENLTKLFDAFEETTASQGGAFEISNMNYQAPIEGDNYNILPVSMTITASQANFQKFLHWVEGSGAFNDETRLMEISSIRLSFASDNPTEVINFNVQINAYFQK